MRKTVVLDDDVNELLRKEMRESGRSFKQVVNERLRLGLRLAEEERMKQESGKAVRKACEGTDPSTAHLSSLCFDKCFAQDDKFSGPLHEARLRLRWRTKASAPRVAFRFRGLLA